MQSRTVKLAMTKGVVVSSGSTKVTFGLANMGVLSLTSDTVTVRGIDALSGARDRSMAVRVSW